jgi:acid phosphatase
MRRRFIPLWLAVAALVGSLVYGVTTSPAQTPTARVAAPKPAGCAHGKKTCSPPPSSSTPAPSTTSTNPPPAGHKVMVIIEENHSQTEAITLMPHLSSWANTYGKATSYTAVTHPSLPNYLAIAGGDTFGVSDDNAPSSHPISGDSVFDQTVARGLSAKTYAEGMTSNCMLTNTGRYAVKHNPWAYFNGATQRANCNAGDVPLGTTTSGNLRTDIDAGALPQTGMMIPDLCNDAHDCTLATADNWLAGWVPALMNGPDYTSGNLTIIVTFDEDDSTAGNNVAFVVIDPRLSGKVVSSAATHYSLTRWLDANVGASPLRNAATAPDLKTAFGL